MKLLPDLGVHLNELLRNKPFYLALTDLEFTQPRRVRFERFDNIWCLYCSVSYLSLKLTDQTVLESITEKMFCTFEAKRLSAQDSGPDLFRDFLNGHEVLCKLRPDRSYVTPDTNEKVIPISILRDITESDKIDQAQARRLRKKLNR